MAAETMGLLTHSVLSYIHHGHHCLKSYQRISKDRHSVLVMMSGSLKTILLAKRKLPAHGSSFWSSVQLLPALLQGSPSARASGVEDILRQKQFSPSFRNSGAGHLLTGVGDTLLRSWCCNPGLHQPQLFLREILQQSLQYQSCI